MLRRRWILTLGCNKGSMVAWSDGSSWELMRVHALRCSKSILEWSSKDQQNQQNNKSSKFKYKDHFNCKPWSHLTHIARQTASQLGRHLTLRSASLPATSKGSKTAHFRHRFTESTTPNRRQIFTTTTLCKIIKTATTKLLPWPSSGTLQTAHSPTVR